MCNYDVKKLPYLLRYVSDRYKTKKMCNTIIIKNGGTLASVLNRYKQELCNKPAENYAHSQEILLLMVTVDGYSRNTY